MKLKDFKTIINNIKEEDVIENKSNSGMFLNNKSLGYEQIIITKYYDITIRPKIKVI